MVKNTMTITLESDVAARFNLLYNGKKSPIINELVKNYIKYEVKTASDDLENELIQLELQKATLISRENQLKSLQETKIKQENQQKLIEERQLIEQEKRNMSIIDDELFNLEEKWSYEKRNKLTQEWKEFLKQNNLLPNDFTRVQYWFRNYKSKGIEL
jgi:DNA gyrase/topoisomerase IV subunit A